MQFSCGFQQLNKTTVTPIQTAQRKFKLYQSIGGKTTRGGTTKGGTTKGTTSSKKGPISSIKQPPGADRDVFLPGAEDTIPEYLDGTLPGDRGFDPLRLSQNETVRSWLANGELYNARWAMIGSLGILAQGIAQKAGYQNDQIKWWEAVRLYPFPFIQVGNEYQQVVFGAQVLVFIIIENARIYDWWNPDGKQSSPNGNYPGGIFDPLNFADQSSPEEFRELQEKEIRNGRLAMSSWFAYNWQEFSTGKGPIDNLLDHLANPSKQNILKNGIHGPHLPDFSIQF